MLTIRHSSRLFATCAAYVCGLLLLAAPASAAPITVNLRVEGSSATLYEGPVTTEALSALSTEASKEAHPCDVKDNGGNEGFGVSAATPTTALYDAATETGLAFNATWSSKFNDFLVTQVGSDVEGGPPEFPAWGYAVNDTTAGVGGCQFQLAPGSEVLWAYDYFNLPHLLQLSGPASASSGTPFSVHVVDGQTGEPLAGAAIGQVTAGVTTTLPGSPTTDASGNATISLSQAGVVALKATRSGSVRSNRVTVCVHNGNDGTCGAPGPSTGSTTSSSASSSASPEGGRSGANTDASSIAITARILGIANGHVYAHGRAPRVLAGRVEVPAGHTLHDVRIRLERRSGKHCFDFSGRKEMFVRAHRCGTASFFSVGDTESFSYLLPTRLPAGRYVYSIEAREDTGLTTSVTSGSSVVVFRVT